MISVLCVDDEPDLLEICREFLEQTGGFSVDTTPVSTGVLPLLAAKTYDAVICDYQMPEKDGLAILKEIRASGNDIPFILFTGRGREEIVIEALNNGADFYLQKGGDISAQFAELASKIRQAVLRRQAQNSLRESEKRLFDIINFLPDATFAINRAGVVIAWNRAIEEMTGVPAASMIGKTDYEYAIPFYGERRPILIDLIFEPDEAITKNYAGITREKDVLVAEAGASRPRGVPCVLAGRASPLYDQNGKITGAIESIRDITSQREAADQLNAAHEQLAASEEELRGQLEELVRAEAGMRTKDAQLQEITSTIPGVVFQFFARPDGTVGTYYVSERSRDILGIEPGADFFGKVTSQVHPDDRDRFLASVHDAVRDSSQWTFEGRVVTNRGRTIWVQGISSPNLHETETVFSGVIFDVSERKSAEDALWEEELKYRTLVEHSQDPVFIIQDGRIVFANAALFQMASRSPGELLGHSLWDIIAPEDKDRVIAINRDRMAGKPVQDSYEFSLLRSDMKTRIRVKVNAGSATYKGLPATLGTFHDVTQEREREDALRKSERRFRDFANLLPQIVVEMDAGLRVTFANENALTALGITRDELEQGVNAIEFIDPSGHERVKENIRQMMRGEAPGNPEYTAVRRDGSRFPVRIYTSPVFQDEKLSGFRCVIVDISDWKAVTNAKQEWESRYHSLTDAAEDLIYIIDRDDTVVYVNRYACEMIGKDPGEVIGRQRREIFPGDVSSRQYQSLQRVFTTGKPLRIESRIPFGGRETWQDTHLVPLRGTDDSIPAVMGISRDISQFKQAEIALKRSNEKLNLLNTITRHDVANQLTILNGYIQLARMKDTDAVLGDFLRKIEGACTTIQRQIDFTRAYQDLGIRAPDWFRLDTVLAKTKPAGLAFTCVCGDYEIFADPMLEKVFFNLFDNAVRHGERVTSMMIRCDREGDELKISVEDDGIGIPLDEKQKIFSKGFGKNTGYGLFLVREILAITNISIHETGKYGSGARFEISVPKDGFRRADVR